MLDLIHKAKEGTALLLLERFMERGDSEGLPLASPQQVRMIIDDVLPHELSQQYLRDLATYAEKRADQLRGSPPPPGMKSTAEDFDRLANSISADLMLRDAEEPGADVVEGRDVYFYLNKGGDGAAERMIERFMGKGDLSLPLATPAQVKMILEEVLPQPLSNDKLGELAEFAEAKARELKQGPKPRNMLSGAADFQALADSLDADLVFRALDLPPI